MNEAMTLDNELDQATPVSQQVTGEVAKDKAPEKQIANMDFSDFVSLLLESRIL